MKWKTVRIGDVCQIISGTTPSTKARAYWDGDLNWVTPGEIEENSKYIFSTQKKITEQAVKETNLRLLPIGTVLLSSRAPIGKVAIAATEMYCNQGFKNLICSNEVHNEFLFWFLKGKKDFLNFLGRGATFKEISKDIVAAIELPLPPLVEQKRIAAILDKADAIRRKRQQSLKLADDLVKLQFIEMFGDPVTNPMGWERCSIRQLATGIVAGESLNGEARQLQKGEKAVLKVSAVTAGFFKPDEYKVVLVQDDIKKNVSPQKGDLLFSRANTRELVGATAIVKQDYPNLILPDKLWKLSFTKDTNVYYMKFVLSSEKIRATLSSAATGTSGSMYNISMEKLRNQEIPLPPIDLQNQFAAFVEQADKSKFSMQNQLSEIEILSSALKQEFFS